ncbi:MAG: nucleotidyltransferase domain-containing protein [Candidatus Aenigmatarchaeota archaeon]
MIKNVAKKILKDKNVKVIVFGSVVKGSFHPILSDIGILVISKNVPYVLERGKILAKIFEKIENQFAPFQIHLIKPSEYEWYKRFIDKKVEIK